MCDLSAAKWLTTGMCGNGFNIIIQCWVKYAEEISEQRPG